MSGVKTMLLGIGLILCGPAFYPLFDRGSLAVSACGVVILAAGYFLRDGRDS